MTDRTIRLGPGMAVGYLRRDGAGFATAHVLRLPDPALTRLAGRLGRSAGGRDPRVRYRLDEPDLYNGGSL